MPNQIAFVLFWGSIGFILLVAASYIGAKFALEQYFGDDGTHDIENGYGER